MDLAKEVMIDIVVNGHKGTLVITDPLTGAFRYTPNPGVSGDDYFVFSVNDGTTDSNFAYLKVNIASVNGPAGNRPAVAALNVYLGDVNCSGGPPDLADVIVALKVLSGNPPGDLPGCSYVDINGNQNIGMKDVLYILQRLSGLRE